MASDLITHLGADDFDQAIAGSPPLLVDFWAEWCGPCKAIAPILDELAVELEGRLRVAKVDVDEHKTLSDRFGVQGIPALLLFEEGEVLATILGARPKEELLATIEPLL